MIYFPSSGWKQCQIDRCYFNQNGIVHAMFTLDWYCGHRRSRSHHSIKLWQDWRIDMQMKSLSFLVSWVRKICTFSRKTLQVLSLLRVLRQTSMKAQTLMVSLPAGVSTTLDSSWPTVKCVVGLCRLPHSWQKCLPRKNPSRYQNTHSNRYSVSF